MKNKVKKFFLLFIATAFLTSGCGLFSPVKIPPAGSDSRTNARSTSGGSTTVKKGMAAVKINLPAKTGRENITVSGNIGYGSRAVINGREAAVNYNGSFAMPYRLKPGPNQIDIEVYSRQGNLIGTVTRTVTFTPEPPKLSVATPGTTDFEPIAAAGVTEPGSTVLVNGIKTTVDAKGRFSRNTGLKVGTNVIEVTSTSKFGQTAAVKKTITFNPVPPKLSVNIPAYSSVEKITLNGVTNPFTLVEVFSNSTNSFRQYDSLAFKGTTGDDGKFSADVKLSAGNNSITVAATNKYGIKAVHTGNIVLKISPPKLYVVDIGTSNTDNVEISGYTDENSSVIVYVNGVKAIADVNDNGKFSARINLAKGSNNIQVVALNKWGLTTQATRKIDYTPPAN